MAPYRESDLQSAFLAAADRVAAERAGIDPEIARELMAEAGQMLHNSLALEGIDERDAATVIGALAGALTAPDPGEAVRACASAADASPEGLHDAPAAAEAYLLAAQVLRI